MFTIDKMSRTPIYEQLIAQFESRILSGDIKPNGLLPSVRYLSQTLNINPNTLQRAYTEIERRGLCYSVPGSGRYLTGDALEKLRQDSLIQTGELREVLQSLKQKGFGRDMILGVVDEIYTNNDERTDISE